MGQGRGVDDGIRSLCIEWRYNAHLCESGDLIGLVLAHLARASAGV